jgi:hypothetical protein
MNSNKLSPSILWSQHDDTVTMRIEVPDLSNVKCDVSDEEFKFSGSNARGEYATEFKFYEKVDSSNVVRTSNDRELVLTINKGTKGSWDSLCQGAVHNVKFDFDRWNGDGIDSEDEGFGNSFGADGMDFGGTSELSDEEFDENAEEEDLGDQIGKVEDETA